MQIGFVSSGSKEEVLADIKKQAVAQKVKFAQECATYQKCIGMDLNAQFIHEAAPIKDTASEDVIDAALRVAAEQLVHLADTEDCTVSFQITVNRRNP